MAIHTRPIRGNTSDWLTPPTVIAALGQFDLDPCAHPEQFYQTADHMIAPPANGLDAEWNGRVWLNPPYGSELRAWISRLAEHGDGIALVPARTEVESWFWPFIWERADAILFLRGRLWFLKPDGTTSGNAGHGSVLAAYGRRNVESLKESGLRGKLVRLLHRKRGN